MGKSSRLTIVLAEARVFFSGMLALLLTLSCDPGAGAVKFSYDGFNPISEVKVRPEVGQRHWMLNTTTGCFYFDPPVATNSGLFLYPDPVEVLNRLSLTVKSFNTTFVFWLQKKSGVSYTGPGMKFILIADDTHEFDGTHESDDLTLSVELPFMNPESNDDIQIQYQQIWIHYLKNSRISIYSANYKKGKGRPDQPSKTRKVPGSSLPKIRKKYMIGFWVPKGINSGIVPHLCAWSFSNDRCCPASPIVIARQDDSTAATPPPPSPSPSSPPPISPPQIPPSPSPSPICPSPSPSPITASSNGGAATPPSGSPPPPSVAPSPGPGQELPPRNVPVAVAGTLAVLVVSFWLFLLCWCTVWRRPLRIFISHAGGPNGAGKNFPSWLHQAMTSHRWSRFKFHVKPFLDVENCPKGLSFAGEIFKELERFDVGVVVVTPDFFSRHWPMTELIKFVEVQRKDREGRIRVLPLFYKLTPNELKQRLDEGTWEKFWEKFSENNYPLQLQKCKDAVVWLCKQTGIRYVSHKRDQDKVYIDTILKEVDKILCDERSFAADLHWVLKKLNITGSCPTATTKLL